MSEIKIQRVLSLKEAEGFFNNPNVQAILYPNGDHFDEEIVIRGAAVVEENGDKGLAFATTVRSPNLEADELYFAGIINNGADIEFSVETDHAYAQIPIENELKPGFVTAIWSLLNL
jgi:hypothetical protein